MSTDAPVNTGTDTLDCSDIDQYLGKPVMQATLREPLRNNDMRRWVQAMHYPNLLHYDPDYAAESRWGRLVAPQSFPIVMDDGHGTSPSCVGYIPDSHLLFGGDEWWFYGPRVFDGDIITNERIPFDYAVKTTSLGPTCFQRGDNFFTNQKGELIAKLRSTAMRYRAAAGGDAVNPADFEDTEWTDEKMKDLEEKKFEWIQMLHDLGHKERWWDDVTVGEALPVRTVGPHTVASMTTEWRSYLFTTWGTLNRRTDLDMAALGFTPEMAGHENDPVMERINPELTDGAYFGPSRGHLFPKFARKIGMPRAYGYGASMGAWMTDYFAGWAGEWGMVVHSVCSYRGPALAGDITITTGKILDKYVDDEGRHLVQVECRMANQKGGTQAVAKAEIELPKKK